MMVLRCGCFHPVKNSMSSGLVSENLKISGRISLDVTEELRVLLDHCGPFSEIKTNIYMQCFKAIMRIEYTCFFSKQLQTCSIKRSIPYHSLFVCSRLFTHGDSLGYVVDDSSGCRLNFDLGKN